MKIKLLTTGLLAAGSLFIVGCDVDKTQDMELPDVDVKGGQLPKYDVDAPDVDVKMKEKTITVPVPDVDVTSPADDGEDGVLGTADDNLDDQ